MANKVAPDTEGFFNSPKQMNRRPSNAKISGTSATATSGKSPNTRKPRRSVTRSRTVRQLTESERANSQKMALIELPAEVLARIKQIFVEFADTAAEINIDRAILKAMLNRAGWGLLHGEIDDLMHRYLINSADFVFNLTFFQGMVYDKICGKISDDELRMAFRTFDKDDNGKIDRAELEEAFACLDKKQFSSDECHEMLEEADADKDGSIDVNEFINLLTSSKRPLLKHLQTAPGS